MVVIPSILGVVVLYSLYAAWLERKEELQELHVKVAWDSAKEDRQYQRRAQERAEEAARDEHRFVYWDRMARDESPIFYMYAETACLGVVIEVMSKGVVIEDQPDKLRHFLKYEDLSWREAGDDDVDTFLASDTEVPTPTPREALDLLFEVEEENF